MLSFFIERESKIGLSNPCKMWKFEAVKTQKELNSRCTNQEKSYLVSGRTTSPQVL